MGVNLDDLFAAGTEALRLWAESALDADLLAAIDEAARRRGQTRSSFIAQAARARIERND